MAPPRVVPPFDEVEDGDPRLRVAPEAMAIEQLALERREEALAHGVVVGVPHAAHRRADAGLAAASAEFDRRVLAALVRVMNDSGRAPRSHGHVQRGQNELGLRMGFHGPADDASAPRVEHHGQAPGPDRRPETPVKVTETQGRLEVKRKAEALRRGWRALPPWVFVNTAGQPLDDSRKVFARALRAAGLPGRFSPHSLRHTFASLLLQAGESPVYVQRQLGHSSIQLTVDTYGRWLPMGNPSAVDRLDDATPARAAAASGGPGEGARGGSRGGLGRGAPGASGS